MKNNIGWLALAVHFGLISTAWSAGVPSSVAPRSAPASFGRVSKKWAGLLSRHGVQVPKNRDGAGPLVSALVRLHQQKHGSNFNEKATYTLLSKEKDAAAMRAILGQAESDARRDVEDRANALIEMAEKWRPMEFGAFDGFLLDLQAGRIIHMQEAHYLEWLQDDIGQMGTVLRLYSGFLSPDTLSRLEQVRETENQKLTAVRAAENARRIAERARALGAQESAGAHAVSAVKAEASLDAERRSEEAVKIRLKELADYKKMKVLYLDSPRASRGANTAMRLQMLVLEDNVTERLQLAIVRGLAKTIDDDEIWEGYGNAAIDALSEIGKGTAYESVRKAVIKGFSGFKSSISRGDTWHHEGVHHTPEARAMIAEVAIAARSDETKALAREALEKEISRMSKAVVREAKGRPEDFFRIENAQSWIRDTAALIAEIERSKNRPEAKSPPAPKPEASAHVDRPVRDTIIGTQLALFLQIPVALAVAERLGGAAGFAYLASAAILTGLFLISGVVGGQAYRHPG